MWKLPVRRPYVIWSEESKAAFEEHFESCLKNDRGYPSKYKLNVCIVTSYLDTNLMSCNQLPES